MMKLLKWLFPWKSMVRVEGARADVNLEYWMTELSPVLRDEPLIYLAIPGSHNSMSYGITRASELAPDAPPALSRLYPLFGGTVVRWTRTQSADVTQQLMLGIRYFDLRVAAKAGTHELFFTHGLYAGEISGPLSDIRRFLDTHPREVVILDFQHFYSMSGHDHSRLIASLVHLFQDKVCPRRADLDVVTLNMMSRYQHQVVIVYRHASVYMSTRLWLPEQMPTPWPRQEGARGLLDFLLALRRHPGTGFVHQAVCTPTGAFIALRFVSSLREQCAVPVREKVFPVLRTLRPGRPAPSAPSAPSAPDTPHTPATINVAIADYVEMNDAEFSRLVVQLNDKLLQRGDLFHMMVRVAPVQRY